MLHWPGVGREVPKWKQKFHSGSSKPLMHRSSFPTKSHVSEHSTRTRNDFSKIASLLARERCYSVTSNMPTLFIDWGSHMSTLLLTQHLFPLEPSLNLKFCPFPRFLGIQQTGTAPECNKLIYTRVTAGCSPQPSQYPNGTIQDIQDIHTAIPKIRIMETDWIHRFNVV